MMAGASCSEIPDIEDARLHLQAEACGGQGLPDEASFFNSGDSEPLGSGVREDLRAALYAVAVGVGLLHSPTLTLLLRRPLRARHSLRAAAHRRSPPNWSIYNTSVVILPLLEDEVVGCWLLVVGWV